MRIYSVSDGSQTTEYARLKRTAISAESYLAEHPEAVDPLLAPLPNTPEAIAREEAQPEFLKFHWSKPMMPLTGPLPGGGNTSCSSAASTRRSISATSSSRLVKDAETKKPRRISYKELGKRLLERGMHLEALEYPAGPRCAGGVHEPHGHVAGRRSAQLQHHP